MQKKTMKLKTGTKKNKITITAVDKKDFSYYKNKKDKFVEKNKSKTLADAIQKFHEQFNINKYNLKSIYNDKLNLKDNNIDYFEFVPYTYNNNEKFKNFQTCVKLISNFFCKNRTKKTNQPFMVKKFLLNYNDNMHMMPLILAKKNNKNYIIMDNNDVYRWDSYFLEFLLKEEKIPNINLITLPPIQNDNKTCYVSSYEIIKHLNSDNIKNIISQCENGCDLLESEKISENNNRIKTELDENKKIEKIYNIPYNLIPSKLLQYAQTKNVFDNNILMQQDGLKEKIDSFVETNIIKGSAKKQNMKLGYRFMRFFEKYEQKQKQEQQAINNKNKQQKQHIVIDATQNKFNKGNNSKSNRYLLQPITTLKDKRIQNNKNIINSKRKFKLNSFN